MKSMEARALKSSFLSELKPNQNIHESLQVNEDFSVDEFLNFSNIQIQTELLEDRLESSEVQEIFSKGSNSLISSNETKVQVVDDFDDLEWLSRVVYDTNPSYPIMESPRSTLPNPKISSHLSRVEFKKSRTKRVSTTTNCGTTWSSSSSSTVASKQKKMKKPTTGKEPAGQIERKCTHCEVQKTPQWRRGPFGPKTLCNACGVRFKSGRLFPEYRPASSPSFSGEIHSNSHRKVLELRKKEQYL